MKLGIFPSPIVYIKRDNSPFRGGELKNFPNPIDFPHISSIFLHNYSFIIPSYFFMQFSLKKCPTGWLPFVGGREEAHESQTYPRVKNCGGKLSKDIKHVKISLLQDDFNVYNDVI
mgnify:CR=1 FL=1